MTTAEMRSRLEDLLSDLHQLESIPPLQRIGNASVHIGTGERWILDLASEALAQREREEMEDSNG